MPVLGIILILTFSIYSYHLFREYFAATKRKQDEMMQGKRAVKWRKKRAKKNRGGFDPKDYFK